MARSPRQVVYVLAVTTALVLGGDATFYAVLPARYGLFGIVAAQVGWMLSVNRLVRVPLNMYADALSRRLGAKVPYVLGLVLGVISTAMYGFTDGFWPLLASRALWGVAWALLVVAAYNLMLRVSDKTTRGQLSGIYTSGSFLGGALGAVLGGVLVDGFGVRAAMWVLAACAGVGVLLALSLPGGRMVEDGEQVVRMPTPAAIVRAIAGSDSTVRLVLGLNFAFRFLFAGVLYSTLGLFLHTALGDEVNVLGSMVGIATFTASLMLARNGLTAVMGPIWGLISDRLRDRSLVLATGELLGALGLACLAAGSTLWVVAIGVVFIAAAYGIIPPMMISWLGDASDHDRQSSAVGAYQTIGDIGSGIGPLVAYAMVEAAGIRTVYALSAVVLVASIPLILSARRSVKGALVPQP